MARRNRASDSKRWRNRGLRKRRDKHSDDNATYLARIPTDPATDTKLDEIKTALGSPLQAGGNVAVTLSLPLATNAATATNQPRYSCATRSGVERAPIWVCRIEDRKTHYVFRAANGIRKYDAVSRRFLVPFLAAAYGGDMAGTEALRSCHRRSTTRLPERARTVVYCYIDALNGDIETIATATLNGTTAVALGAGVRAKTSNGWKFAPPDPRRTTRERSRYARPERAPRGNKSPRCNGAR